MTPCLDENDLVAFGDGTLSGQALDVASRHLRECDVCRGALASIYDVNGERRGAAERLDSMAALLPVGPRAERLAPGTAIGRYRIERVRGEGGMGVVYEATDPQLARKVALKFLRSASATSTRVILQEAQALARISHPNVVPIFDVGTHEGHVFIAMEFIDGTTLGEWLTTRPARDEVLRAFIAAGEGLAAAHDSGLVHRDFKPANVLRRSDGRVFVTDFGLAITQPQPGTAEAHTADRAGTPASMAPEQLAGRPVDARADQFSLCAALAEALTGTRAFEGDTPQARLAAIERGALRADLSRLPRGLAVALRRGLEADPARRFPDVHALVAALRPRRRARWALATASALLALGVGVGVAGAAWHRPVRCDAGAGRMTATWNDAARDALRRTITQPSRPWSRDLASTLTASLDGWARAWVASYDDACAATHVRHEQSERLLDLRMACLERRRIEFEAVTAALGSLDERSLDSAPALVRGLRSVGPCSDTRRLDGLAQPLSESGHAEAQALLPRVSQLKALHDAGRLAEGWAKAEALLPALASAESLSVKAEGWLWAGVLKLRLGAPERARELLSKALTTASVNRDDEVLTRALCQLLELASNRLHDVAATREYRDLVTVVRARGPLDHELEAIVENQLGLASFAEGDLEAALRHFQASRDHSAHVTGPSARNALRASNNAAVILADLGKPVEALAVLTATLPVLEAELGTAHPDVGRAEVNLGAMLNDLKRFDEALRHLEVAQHNFERAYGPAHAELAAVHNNLGDTWLGLNRPADASKAFERALALRATTGDQDNPSVVGDLVGIGTARLAQGLPAEAVAPLERAIALLSGSKERQGTLGKAEALLARALPPGTPRRAALLEAARGHLEAGGAASAAEVATLPSP
ncbi:MAG: tetratricopeptide repeat protein [Myxococcaceae bacterium]|nr:tetratricopeptide repeat protein [Myxococcaceae bacterium]MCA3015078.1 tetratricopeptide repeat protein [Myxococcaceae bacterium]